MKVQVLRYCDVNKDVVLLIQVHGLPGLCPESFGVLGPEASKGEGWVWAEIHINPVCSDEQFRSPLSEGALLEDNPVCNRTSSWTPGCLDHLLQLVASKTGRWGGGEETVNRTTKQWGTQAALTGKQCNQNPGIPLLSSCPSAGSSGVARRFAYEICGAPHGKGRVILSVHREDVRGGSHLPLIIYLFLLFAGQFLEELSKFSSLSYKLRTKSQERETEATKKGLLKTPNPRTGGAGKYGGGGLALWGRGKKAVVRFKFTGGTEGSWAAPIYCLICSTRSALE